MPISLILTPFDHFQNMSSCGKGPNLILTLCLNQSDKANVNLNQTKESRVAMARLHLIREASLSRTLSTSVLRIKKRRGFWEKLRVE